MNLAHKIILIFFITAASIFATFITPEVGSLKKLFSIDDSCLNYIMINYLAGYLLGQIFFANFSKKHSSIYSIRRGFFIALLAFFLEYMAVIFKNYNIFLISRTISAFGLSSGLVCGFAIIKDNISDNEEKSYLSIITIMFTGSIYFSIFISGILEKYCGLLSIFKNEIYYCIGLLLLTFFIPNIKKVKYKTAYYNNFDLNLIFYSFSLSITTIVSYCYSFYAPLIIINNYGLSLQKFVYYNLINMLGLFLGGFLYKKISKKIKEIYLIIFCLLSITISSMLLIITYNHSQQSLQCFILIFFLINIASGVIYPAATFKSMECGLCKTSSSATMNTIKIGMPSIALYISSFITKNAYFNLSIIIFVFSTLFLSFTFIQKMKQKLPA